MFSVFPLLLRFLLLLIPSQCLLLSRLNLREDGTLLILVTPERVGQALVFHLDMMHSCVLSLCCDLPFRGSGFLNGRHSCLWGGFYVGLV
jgi:hypothetical protein